jgi:hypothetical protein
MERRTLFKKNTPKKGDQDQCNHTDKHMDSDLLVGPMMLWADGNMHGVFHLARCGSAPDLKTATMSPDNRGNMTGEIMSFARHAIRILLGYVAAALAVGLIGACGPAVANWDTLTVSDIPSLLFIAAVVGALVAVLALPGAAFAILCSEWFALRRWSFFAGIGALSGIAASFFPSGKLTQLAHFDGSAFFVVLIFGLLGMVGGTVYWFVSGRWAGVRNR